MALLRVPRATTPWDRATVDLNKSKYQTLRYRSVSACRLPLNRPSITTPTHNPARANTASPPTRNAGKAANTTVASFGCTRCAVPLRVASPPLQPLSGWPWHAVGIPRDQGIARSLRRRMSNDVCSMGWLRHAPATRRKIGLASGEVLLLADRRRMFFVKKDASYSRTALLLVSNQVGLLQIALKSGWGITDEDAGGTSRINENCP
mgnify:CR=1 FL=1